MWRGLCHHRGGDLLCSHACDQRGGGGVALGTGGVAAYGRWSAHTEDLGVLEEMLWFVPAMALFLFMVEIATTFRSAIASTTIYRLAHPVLTLVWIAPHIMQGLTAEEAIGIYGGAWVVSLAILCVYMAVSAPKGLYSGRISVEPRSWLSHGIGFLGLSLLMTLLSQSAILILEIVKGDRAGVALLSASLQIAGLAIILQTSTMRIFAPELARRVAAKDLNGQRELLRRRGRAMVVLGGILLLLVMQFGREFLGLFGQNYREAYSTVVLLTFGNVVYIALGSAPVFLQFHGRHRLALAWAAAGTVIAFTAVVVAANFGDYATVAQVYTAALVLFCVGMEIAARLVARSLAREQRQSSAV